MSMLMVKLSGGLYLKRRCEKYIIYFETQSNWYACCQRKFCWHLYSCDHLPVKLSLATFKSFIQNVVIKTLYDRCGGYNPATFSCNYKHARTQIFEHRSASGPYSSLGPAVMFPSPFFSNTPIRTALTNRDYGTKPPLHFSGWKILRSISGVWLELSVWKWFGIESQTYHIHQLRVRAFAWVTLTMFGRRRAGRETNVPNSIQFPRSSSYTSRNKSVLVSE